MQRVGYSPSTLHTRNPWSFPGSGRGSSPRKPHQLPNGCNSECPLPSTAAQKRRPGNIRPGRSQISPNSRGRPVGSDIQSLSGSPWTPPGCRRGSAGQRSDWWPLGKKTRTWPASYDHPMPWDPQITKGSFSFGCERCYPYWYKNLYINLQFSVHTPDVVLLTIPLTCLNFYSPISPLSGSPLWIPPS